MDHHLLGRSCALGAAVLWAFALVLFKRGGETVPPLALNLFKNTVGLLLLGITLLLTGEGLAPLRGHAGADIAILLGSGLLGIAVADTLLFHSLNLVGVGRLAIVECLYSPMVIVLSWCMLSEKLTVTHWIGAALVVAGVLISSQPDRAGRSRAQIALGVVTGAVALLFMSFGIVWIKPVLDRFPLIWAATLRLLAGTLSLAVYMALLPERTALFGVFRPSASWKAVLPGSLIGGYACLVLWIAGFKYTQPSVAAILNQTSTVFALILATVLLKECFGRRKLVAVALSMTGVAVVMLEALRKDALLTAFAAGGG